MGDGTAPFGWTWNSITAANGEHILVAVATDAGGNTGTSAPVTVTVDNPPDSVVRWVDAASPG